MKYYSLNNKEHHSDFENAVVRGLAPDKGLYFPERIPQLSSEFISNLKSLNSTEIGMHVISPFVSNEIPETELQKILEETLSFNFPVKKIEPDVSVLELFHGPTLAFKDVGARFMAGSLGYFIKKGNLGKVTVLVATSGDTGGAVANGFLGVDGIDVVILYPKGKVSEIQEKQLTTLGENIQAIEVDGNFDDCQGMVKKAFLDSEITDRRQLTSANSINLARWLPQMFYYFLAYRQLETKNKVAFSVPSGNFGNICAGLLAKKMGLPIDTFVAANNANDTVTRFMESQDYQAKQSVQTISNAMDVGDPSNFVRILELFGHHFKDLKKHLMAMSYTDSETNTAIRSVYEKHNYLMDPHGAVGYLGLKDFLKINSEYNGVFLETAHPVKFLKTVEKASGAKVSIPESIAGILNKKKKSFQLSTYGELKEFLLEDY
ncbi:threonine synthase [Christiangramia sp. OXR-203]|uniref:threonine synthase n=1 Tax=Christiangramia sp. OXR-203 TaxID=3100176 RepID=UPI002AC9465E|nr:threonine synthase [Christiangramia sp. OXR-203]WPY99748.1 threonine synthase [Christiangramia sp. OXR-203]